MGRAIQREKDIEFDLDLESGGNTSEEEASNDERESKNGFPWSWNGVVNFDGSSEKGKIGIDSCSSSSNSGDVVGLDEYNLELLVDNGLEHVNGINNHAKLKNKFLTNPRKPPKPPLPPKGPSLDAGDQKFVKELAELALRKRARIKKMKAVRKMRASKSSSSSSTYTNLSAMVITVFFFLVIILHGKLVVLVLVCLPYLVLIKC